MSAQSRANPKYRRKPARGDVKRGVGRVQRRVWRAFISGDEWTTRQLAEWVWPRGFPRGRNMWRVRREARKWALPADRIRPGGILWRRRVADKSSAAEH
jgi:hypothetical protein